MANTSSIAQAQQATALDYEAQSMTPRVGGCFLSSSVGGSIEVERHHTLSVVAITPAGKLRHDLAYYALPDRKFWEAVTNRNSP